MNGQKRDQKQSVIRQAIHYFILLAFISLFVFSGCGSNETKTENDSIETKSEIVMCAAPVIIVAAFDQSGSMKWSGSPPVTVDDLRPLLDKLKNCGGEIGILFVRGRSDLGIERLTFPEPQPPLTIPSKAENEENYEFLDRLAAFREKENERVSLMEKQIANMEQKTSEFLQRIGPLLSKPFSGRTDLNSGLNRANVFLSEPADFWRRRPAKFLLVVSDGKDTEMKPRFSNRGEAAVLWVDGTSDRKSSPSAQSVRFENFAAAVRHITQLEIERSKNDVDSR